MRKNSDKQTRIGERLRPVKLNREKEQTQIARRRTVKNPDYVIDWSKVEVTDKTLLQIAKQFSLDEDTAFDKAFEILELHDEFRKDAQWIYRSYLKNGLRGEWVHLSWFTIENLQIGIENNKWTRFSLSQDKTYLSNDKKQSVYDAEEGRCEQCGQAMHYRVSYIQKRQASIFGDMDNLKLLCYACAHHRSNMLLNPAIQISSRNLDYLSQKLKLDVESAKQFIRSNIHYAVHTNTFNPNQNTHRKQVAAGIRGQYWLPGIGKFRLINKHRTFWIEFSEIARDPVLLIRTQTKSRKLSKKANS